MTLIPPPVPAGHDCLLPWRAGTFGSTGVEDGTLFLCPCGRDYYSGPCSEHYGPTEQWYAVAPWHFRLRRRAKAARAEQLDVAGRGQG